MGVKDTGVEMKSIRQRTWIIALLVILALFAGCKGESPTAPPSGGGTTPPGSGGGGTTPPTGATLALTVSNPNPVIDSTSTITATVTINGQPAPNGTAVEFSTTNGTFTNVSPASASIIRTTTNGVATAVLTSSTVGTATVTAVVNNVIRTTTITFVDRPVVTPPPDTTPTITAVTPSTGRPGGGQTIRITGTNFRAPVRVLFSTGTGTPAEAFVVSVTPTEIVAVTPPVNLGAGQQLAAQVIVIVDAGTAAEQRITAATPFTYQNDQLTPVVSTVSPNTGPLSGGTRVTIFGEGFQAPVLVQFGDISGNVWTNAQIINVTFNQIVAVTPPARDLAPAGNAPVSGPVDLRIVNINSNKTVEVDNAFRFTPAMQITTISPSEGPFTGGTDITIDGIGFDDPLAVSVAGFAVSPIRVSGTQILVRTPAIAINTCGDQSGPVVVTNTETGITATGPAFTFRVPRPVVVGVSGNPTPGGSITVTVLNAIGIPRLQLGNFGLSITSSVANPDGTTTFTATIPTTITLNTQACTTQPTVQVPIPTAFDVVYTSLTTTCTNTLTNGATVNPAATPRLAFVPSGFSNFTATAVIPPVPPAVTPTPAVPAQPQTVNIINSGAGTLTITNVTTVPGGAGNGCAQFAINAPTPGTQLQQCGDAPLTVSYITRATPGGPDTCQIVVQTDAGNRTFTVSGTTQ